MNEDLKTKLVLFSLVCIDLHFVVTWYVVKEILVFIMQALVNKYGFFEGSILLGCFLITINLWLFYRCYFWLSLSKKHT